MTDRDKQRLDELEEKTAYIMARQDQQDAKMNGILARLAYIEAKQYRIMKKLGIEPDQIETPDIALEDAKAINLSRLADERLN